MPGSFLNREFRWLLLGLVPFVSLVLLVFMLLPSTSGGNRFGATVPHG